MTDTPERQVLDVLLRDIQAGRADEVLDEIDTVVQGRKFERDRWQPLNELMDVLRTVERFKAEGSAQEKASTGASLNGTLKRYAEHPDPAVRGLAHGVRQRVFTDLLGMTAEQVAQFPVPGAQS